MCASNFSFGVGGEGALCLIRMFGSSANVSIINILRYEGVTLDTVGPTVAKVTPSYLRILITLTCRKYYCHHDLVGHYNDLGGHILLASAIENSIGDDSGAHWIRVRC